MAKRKWIEIPDCDVVHIWGTADDDSCLADEDNAHVGRNYVSIPPTYYAGNGTPCCGDCGADMVYVRTEIRLPKETT